MRTRLSTANRLLAVSSCVLVLFCAMASVAVAAKKKAPAPRPAATATSPGKADASAAPAGADSAEQAKVKVERGAGGKKVYRIEGEIVIEGKIQKPEAFYVLQKSSINYDWHELKQEFVPKILDSVTKAPF